MCRAVNRVGVNCIFSAFGALGVVARAALLLALLPVVPVSVTGWYVLMASCLFPLLVHAAPIPLSDVVTAGDVVVLREYAITQPPVLTFSPRGSHATVHHSHINGWQLGPIDHAGDYVVAMQEKSSGIDVSAGKLRRWRATEFPTAFGGREPLLFSDGFGNGEVTNADSDFDWWQLESSPTCSITESSGMRGPGLQISPGTSSRLCLLESRAAPALSSTRGIVNFFAQQTIIELDGVRLTANTAAVLAPGLRALTASELGDTTQTPSSEGVQQSTLALSVQTDEIALSLQPETGKSESSQAGKTILVRLAVPPGCCQEGCNISLTVDVRNATVSVRHCANDVRLKSLPSAFTAHGIELHRWGPVGAGGASVLQLGGRSASGGGGGLSFRALRVRSGLMPGADRLRPLAHVPALPATLAPMIDGASGWTPRALVPFEDMGKGQPLAPDGFVDVTAAPFSADPTGMIDATAALQRAIDWARWHLYGVYLPIGEYRVTAPLLARQVSRQLSTGHVPGMLHRSKPGDPLFTPSFLLDGVTARWVPTLIRGEVDRARPGRRATLRVPPRTAAFANASHMAYVLAAVFDNPLGEREPNEMYNSVMQSVNLVIGEGNAGAIGVRWRGAQGSGLEDVSVRFEGSGPDDGLVGVVGGAGSGGAHHGITVIGGRYGMDLRDAQPASTLTRATLINQSCAALLYEGYESLSAVGVVVAGFRGCTALIAGYPAELPRHPVGCALPPLEDGHAQQPNGRVSGPVSLIDATVDFEPYETQRCPHKRSTITSNRSVYLRNVFVRGAELLARFPAQEIASPAASPLWSHAHELAHGENVEATQLGNWSFQPTSPGYVNGVRTPAGESAISNISVAANAPSAIRVQSVHGWGEAEAYPSWESPGALNAVRPPAGSGLLAAVGDGFTDDAPAIQAALHHVAARPSASGVWPVVYLPRGIYALATPLFLPAGVALVGAARHLTRLVPATKFDGYIRRDDPSTPEEPAFLLHVMEGAAPRESILSHMGITVWNHLANVSALRWAAHTGIIRQFQAQRSSRCGALPDAGCEHSVPIDAPLHLVTSSARLSWFTFYLEDCCRSHVVNGVDVGPLAYWDSFLAGPQQQNYRHLLVRDAGITAPQGSLRFYQLNCEHGTGEAICEFDGVRGVDIFGFKTEGNGIALLIRNSQDVRLSGSGGVGCVEDPSSKKATFVLENTSAVTFANLADQGSMRAPHTKRGYGDEFGEAACVPTASHTLRHEATFVTAPLEHPVVYKQARAHSHGFSTT